MPDSSIQRVPAGLAAGEAAGVTAAALARAAGRPLIVVVRDAHRDAAVRDVVSGLVAARPDTVVVEMGLPLWVPPARRAPRHLRRGARERAGRGGGPGTGPVSGPRPPRIPSRHDQARANFLLIRSRSAARRPVQWPATCIMLDMRLSARADYALRAAVELAAADGGHITAEQLARAQHIPGKFLEAILTQLRRAGLVRSQRGPEGGFWLAKPASDIALADIIRAIDGQLVGVRGERPENIGYIGVAEPLQSVWIALRANERAILEEVTLEHIATGRLPERIVELTDDPRAWA